MRCRAIRGAFEPTAAGNQRSIESGGNTRKQHRPVCPRRPITAAAARIRDSNGNDVITGLTVGTVGSGADIIFESVSFNVGEIITLNSATITAN